MDSPALYLASASPRRSALLRQIGVDFQVVQSDVPELIQPGEPAEQAVLRLAAGKAAAVWDMTRQRPRPVLGADTVVVVGGEILGKPRDETHAREMMTRLSGVGHRVVTGVALRDDAGCRSRVSVSEVRFRTTTAAERQAYCETGEPMDKAGAYAVQGFGAAFITHINGSYSGIMGLPLAETVELLASLGQPAWLAGGRPHA